MFFFLITFLKLVILKNIFHEQIRVCSKHFIYTHNKRTHWFHDMQKLKLYKLHKRLSNKYLQIPFEVTERKQMNLDECIERAKTTTF